MKRKREQRAERRRAAVEPNLAAHTAPRSAVGPRGCAALLGRFLMLVLLAIVWAIGLR